MISWADARRQRPTRPTKACGSDTHPANRDHAHTVRLRGSRYRVLDGPFAIPTPANYVREARGGFEDARVPGRRWEWIGWGAHPRRPVERKPDGSYL